MGRQSSYTPEIAREICERLAAGETLRAICRSDERYPSEVTVRRWALDNVQGFAAQYALARDLGLDAIADETFEISDDGRNDWVEKQRDDGSTYIALDAEHVARSRLRLDTRKWYLSKLAPKRYGDALKLSGDPEAPLVPAPADPAAALAAILASAAKRREESDASDLA